MPDQKLILSLCRTGIEAVRNRDEETALLCLWRVMEELYGETLNIDLSTIAYNDPQLIEDAEMFKEVITMIAKRFGGRLH